MNLSDGATAYRVNSMALRGNFRPGECISFRTMVHCKVRFCAYRLESWRKHDVLGCRAVALRNQNTTFGDAQHHICSLQLTTSTCFSTRIQLPYV